MARKWKKHVLALKSASGVAIRQKMLETACATTLCFSINNAPIILRNLAVNTSHCGIKHEVSQALLLPRTRWFSQVTKHLQSQSQVSLTPVVLTTTAVLAVVYKCTKAKMLRTLYGQLRR